MPRKPVRLLMVEDTEARVATIRGWLPTHFERHGVRVAIQLLQAASAGAALGVIARARPGEWDAVLLDHDLGEQARTTADLGLTGRDVARALIARTARLGSLRILVHSMSPIAGAMAEELARAGHAVDQHPFATLDAETFLAWLDLVLDDWEAT